MPKRIVPCLDVDHGKVVKGINFLQLQHAGDPVEMAKRYSDEGARRTRIPRYHRFKRETRHHAPIRGGRSQSNQHTFHRRRRHTHGVGCTQRSLQRSRQSLSQHRSNREPTGHHRVSRRLRPAMRSRRSRRQTQPHPNRGQTDV